MSFGNLKKKSKASLNELANKVNSEKKGGFEDDARYWKFTTDKSQNGYAVIRFLPPVDGEEIPFVKFFSYGIKSKKTGKWYIERSRGSISYEERDPMDEYRNALWQKGAKEEARNYPRSKRYVSNILVISDPNQPENEGKNFLWEYGPAIFNFIESATNPEFEDETPFNPFDFWEGANFKIKAYQKSSHGRSYEKSGFESVSALYDGDDEKLEALWKKQYPLQPEIALSKYKSYDELKKRFDIFMGNTPINVQNAIEKQYAEEPKERAIEKPEDDAPWDIQREDDDTSDDDLAAYASLLEE